MYKNIRACVEADFNTVNQFIVDQLHSDVALVESIGHYIVDAGGKRMRPILVLLCARSANINTDDHIKLAAVIEFIHTATLLHDDVVDTSTMRRGRPTANSQWNNPSSVLVGDFIYSRAFQVLVSLGNQRIMEIIADTTNRIAEGEVLQLINKHNVDITETQYLDVIRNKTSILFEAAAQCAAILARAEENLTGSYRDFGLHVGNAFQLIDDVLDYAGDSQALGKNIGDDLAEGKPTLPLIYAMKNGNESDASLIRENLIAIRTEDMDRIIALVQKSGGLEYTRGLAEQEVAIAKSCLEKIPPSPYRDALEKMAELAINRVS